MSFLVTCDLVRIPSSVQRLEFAMYDPTGRVVAGAFAVVLIYLSVMAIRTGVIFGRGIPYRLSEHRSSFLSALIAQIGFAIFLMAIAAGYEPLKLLKNMSGF